MTDPMWLSVVFAAFLLSSLGTLGLVKWLEASGRRDARSEADRILALAESDAQNRRDRAVWEAKEAALAIKADAEREIAGQREQLQTRGQELKQRDAKLKQWEETLRKQARGNESTQLRLTNQLEAAQQEKAELESLKSEQTHALQEVAQLTR